MEEKKNKFPWDTLETFILMMPIEVLTYHVYKYNDKTSKKASETDLQIIKSYLYEQKKEKSESECLKR